MPSLFLSSHTSHDVHPPYQPSSVSRTYSYNISPPQLPPATKQLLHRPRLSVQQIHPTTQRHPPILFRIQLRLFNQLSTLPIRHPLMIHPTRPPPNTPTSSTPHPRNHAAYPAPHAPLLHRCPGPESRRDAIHGKHVIVVIVVVAGRLRQPQIRGPEQRA